jgi:hypothetical protein
MWHEVLDSPFVFVIGILVVTVAVPIVVTHWSKTRKREMEVALKHDMLQRGMTAEEIKTVLEATADPVARRGRDCRIASREYAGWKRDHD